MKTFYSDKFSQVEDAYKNICCSYPNGLDLFLKLQNLKNSEGNYDLKLLISEHEEEIGVYEEYTKNSSTYPNAAMLYINKHPLNVDSARFINENLTLIQLTEEFYKATKKTTPCQYRAFGLTERDRDEVDESLSQRKSLLLKYINVLEAAKGEDEEESKPKVEAYTIDAKDNKISYLENELNGDDSVFVIDETTWGEYINHVVFCMKNAIRIKDDIKLIHKNKFLITRCYREVGYNCGITIKSIYEIKKDSPLKQYVDVCNTARRFAEQDYSSAYKSLVSRGVFKAFHPELSLIECLYIVSHVELLKKQQDSMLV
ncbi:MAG: hypothetical protein K6E54_05895 [Bacteroidaceae bacterium]|nr:hypothetical protein [Bacteroidaceae bacterium]